MADASFALKRRWDDDVVFRNQVGLRFATRQGRGLQGCWRTSAPCLVAGVLCCGDVADSVRPTPCASHVRQARGEPKAQKRFINDTIRNDFHRRFIDRYIK